MKRKLLSVLLTLAMALALLSVSAMAEGAEVAQIGETKYATLAEAIAAAQDGNTVTLLADINTPDTSYYIDKRLTIDLKGKTVTGSGYDGVFSITGADAEVCIKNGAVVAVEGSGSAGKYTMAVWAHAAGCTVTLEALTVSQQITHADDKQMDMIYASAGTIIINSGSFTSGTPKWTLNIKDSAYKDGSANIIVNGGTFVGYDPRNAENEGKGTSLVAEGVGVDADSTNGTFTAKSGMAAQIVDAAGNSVKAYAMLSDAFADVKTGDTVKLLNNITLTNQVDITKALDGLTLDGNGKTITLATTTNPMQSGGSALYFGNADSRLYCTGIKIKDLTMTGTARFAIFLCGGTSTEFTNVNISGNYYIAINLYGTHGATMTNCKISNSTTGTDEYISGIWSNVASQNPLKLVSTEVDTIAINTYTTANKLEPKIFIDKDSKAEIHTFDDGSVSGNKKLCVSTESTGSYTVKEYDGTSSTWVEVPDVAVVIRNGREIGCATFTAAIAAAQNGDTVKLLKDVDENVTIPAGKSITLDLNGKVLSGGTVASTPALLNNGTVTIKDSSAEGTGMIRREDNNAAGYYVIENQGTMTIENGSVYNATGTMPDGSSLIRNAGKSNEATLIINGGHIKQDGFIAIKNDDHGVLEINGGLIETSGDTATNTASAVQNWAKATINNGTINGTIWVGVWNNALPSSVTTIKNAEVNGKIVVKPDSSGLMVAPKLNIEGGNFDVTGWDVSNSDNIDISGGNFSTDLKNTGYLADSVGAEVKSADGSTYGYYANVAAATAAAKPGDTVTDLKASDGQKVTLTMKYNDGATADSTYNVASGTTITLPTPKRSGYTFNGWYDGSTKVSSPYEVTKDVTLTASWSYISSGSSSYDPTYSVSTPSKTENGSVTVSPKNASKGDTVTVTVKPDSGYVLETLTVTDKNGNELTLKDKGNGKYTFTMPAGKVEVKATFMEDNSMLNFFYDVPNNAYFYEAVKWAVKNGITTGVGNNLFAPEQPCTRAQIVTFLWRAAGSPEPKGAASGMTDVVSGSYYEKAVAWAIENGITTGTTTSTFSPDVTCTRAQAVTFLARALKAKAASAAEFSDVPTGSYFADAVAWAAANGVTEGIGGGLFGSDNDCTRGQIVTFLYRAYNK